MQTTMTPRRTCPECRRTFATRREDGLIPWHLRLGTGQTCGTTPWQRPA